MRHPISLSIDTKSRSVASASLFIVAFGFDLLKAVLKQVSTTHLNLKYFLLLRKNYISRNTNSCS
jgi:hypothetical protein